MVQYIVEFTYLKKKFIGDNVTIYSNEGIHLEVGDKKILFKDWDEVRDFMSRYEEINKEAALTKRRQKYGKDLIISYDEDEGFWTVFWKGHSVDVRAVLLRELSVVLRFFIRRYHRLMLDYGTHELKEGFTVETGSARFMGAVNTGL